ncbi:MAG: hypothetical protein ACK5KO_09775 [Arachnia sp.]
MNALLPGFGGPMGKHAKPRGLWFNPVAWTIITATALFIIAAVRQVPCIQTDETNPINAYIRLCYSDIPLAYTSSGFGLGAQPLSGDALAYPPLLGVIILAVLTVSKLLGATIEPNLDLQGQLDGAQIFFAVAMVVLFAAFLIWSLAMTLLGRDSRNARYRSWDALLVSASPMVLASGLIAWELIPIALCAVALVLFASRRTIEAGIVFGLAASTGPLALTVLAAVIVAAALRRGAWIVLQVLLPALVTWGLIHLPLMLTAPGAMAAFYRGQLGLDAGYGSLWYLARLFGWQVREAGYLAYLLLAVVAIVTLGWLYVSRRRPRVGTMIALTVFPTILLGPAYPPQLALWLLFALVLARPFRVEIVWFLVAELGYYLAVWGHLAGHLAATHNGPENLYYLALILHLSVGGWILVNCVRDVTRPRRDRLRRPDTWDPIGGPLNDCEATLPSPARTPRRASMADSPA